MIKRVEFPGSSIIAIQEPGYGEFEFDLKDVNTEEYIGLVLGTTTRNGLIWDIQKWRNGQPTGAIMRLPATSPSDALADAVMFCE
jgi:hypothetical protein